MLKKFSKHRRETPQEDIAQDDNEIRDSAREAIGESRKQIGRATRILENEILRMDAILEGKIK